MFYPRGEGRRKEMGDRGAVEEKTRCSKGYILERDQKEGERRGNEGQERKRKGK